MKNELLKELSEIASRQTGYHNHKETIAWAALLLYFIFVTQLANKISCEPFSTFILLLVAGAVWFILHTQYKLREQSANVIGACQRLIVKFISMKDDEIPKIDFSLEDLSKPDLSKNKHFSFRNHFPYIFPKFLLDEMKKLEDVGHSPRKGLEWMSYLLLIVGTFAGLLAIWFPIPPCSG